LPPYKRPWQSTVPPLEASVEEVVPFPSDDEEHGMVKIAWRIAKAKVRVLKLSQLILAFPKVHFPLVLIWISTNSKVEYSACQ